jgi:hypothetical protein
VGAGLVQMGRHLNFSYMLLNKSQTSSVFQGHYQAQLLNCGKLFIFSETPQIGI